MRFTWFEPILGCQWSINYLCLFDKLMCVRLISSWVRPMHLEIVQDLVFRFELHLGLISYPLTLIHYPLSFIDYPYPLFLIA